MPYSPNRYHNGDGPPTVPHPPSSTLPQQREPSDPQAIDEATTEVPVIRPGDLGTGRSSWEPLAAPAAEVESEPATEPEPADADAEEADAEVADAEVADEVPPDLRAPWLDLATPQPSAGPDPEEAAEFASADESGAAAPGLPAEAEQTPPQLEEEPTDMPLATENLDPTTDPEATAVDAAPPAVPAAGPMRPGDVVEEPIAVWSEDAAAQLRAEWRELHVLFIDDPDAAVTGAKRLVTEAVHALSERLLAEQDDFDPMADGDSPDTESMRIAMRRYRDFLDRVLAL